MGIVLAAETMNTALERLADRVSEDYEEGIRDAKDLAAGAVLLASTMSAVVFAVIVVSKLV